MSIEDRYAEILDQFPSTSGIPFETVIVMLAMAAGFHAELATVRRQK
jgi:hypothetical protein